MMAYYTNAFKTLACIMTLNSLLAKIKYKAGPKSGGRKVYTLPLSKRIGKLYDKKQVYTYKELGQ